LNRNKTGRFCNSVHIRNINALYF